MRTLTITDFRNQMAASLDRADAGEKIMIRRRNRLYSIVPVEESGDNEITPALRRKINEARREHAQGNYVECKTLEDLKRYFDAL